MGRPVGSKDKGPRNTVARKHASELAEQGITPLGFMIEVLREQYVIRHDTTLPDDTRQAATVYGCAIAEKAAPYLHAKLSAIEMNANVRRSMDDFSEEELALLAGEDEGEAGA